MRARREQLLTFDVVAVTVVFHDPRVGASSSVSPLTCCARRRASARDRSPLFSTSCTDRTTDGTGRIATQNYHGGLDQLRTVQAPHQKIPLLRETLDLLMQPANQHVLLNIDVKVDNDPERLFTIMKSIISSYADFETKLAPRLRASLSLSHTSSLLCSS